MHKHKDLIIAWAKGAKIEYQLESGGWCEVDNPNWDSYFRFRIKPSKVERLKELIFSNNGDWDQHGDFLTFKIYRSDLETVLNKLCNQPTETQP